MHGLYGEELFVAGEDRKPMVIDADDYPDTTCVLSKNHGFGPIPEKRQKRAAFVSIALSCIVLIVLLGAFTKPDGELYVVESNVTARKNEMYCKKNDQYYHVGIFIWSLNLVGIIFGEFVNRLCLVSEEYFHLCTRYSGSKMKMFHACFSDISFRAVFFATLVAFIIIGSTLLSQGTEYFKYEYIEIILSGVGSSALVIYLLNLDTLSRVQISSLMENNNRLVANGLAWSYYFGYLKLILPGLKERIDESEWRNKLSSKKLFILMPRDCWAYGTLTDEDERVELPKDCTKCEDCTPEDCTKNYIEVEIPHGGVRRRLYRNHVYKVNTNDPDSPLHILAEYATPLCSVYDMSHSAEACLSEEDRDEQAKLFLRTLKAILSNPSVPEVRNKCKLVPYARGPGVSVANILADAVREDNEELDSVDGDGEDEEFEIAVNV